MLKYYASVYWLKLFTTIFPKKKRTKDNAREKFIMRFKVNGKYSTIKFDADTFLLIIIKIYTWTSKCSFASYRYSIQTSKLVLPKGYRSISSGIPLYLGVCLCGSYQQLLQKQQWGSIGLGNYPYTIRLKILIYGV